MNHRPSGFGSLLLALTCVSFVPSWAVAAPRVPTHVACVGDSITYGYGASNQATKSYPANLQTLFGSGVQVKNFGRNSATMLSAPFGDLPYEDQTEYAAATSFVSGAGASAVVDVIIMLGTNDSKNYNWAPGGKPKNDQQFLGDYRAMVEHFSALAPKPLVFLALPLATGQNPCCSIDGSVIHDQIVPLIRQLAAEKHLPTIDLNTPTTGHPEYFGDGVHPNDQAYALVAKLMHDGLLADTGTGGTGTGGAGAGAGAGAGTGGAGAGTGGAGGAGGTSGPAMGGSAGGPCGGSASHMAGAGNGAGSGPGAGASAGGVAAHAAGSSSSSPAADSEDRGCAVSRSPEGAGSWSALGLLGLGGLFVRRRAR